MRKENLGMIEGRFYLGEPGQIAGGCYYSSENFLFNKKMVRISRIKVYIIWMHEMLIFIPGRP